MNSEENTEGKQYGFSPILKQYGFSPILSIGRWETNALIVRPSRNFCNSCSVEYVVELLTQAAGGGFVCSRKVAKVCPERNMQASYGPSLGLCG